MIRTPAHLGIATRNIDEALVALGSRGKPPTELEFRFRTPSGLVVWTLQRAYTKMGSLIVELLNGSPGTIWHTSKLLDFHHYAYWSDDLGGETQRLVSDGWHCEATLVSEDDHPFGFAYLARSSLPRIELIASELRPSPTTQ